jgi:hypothetical protein
LGEDSKGILCKVWFRCLYDKLTTRASLSSFWARTPSPYQFLNFNKLDMHLNSYSITLAQS